jgi:predicted anti-sigma-YlaC factor YlaD
MTSGCPTTFDETLISGYLDGELTQADDQRVRLHLRRCDHCRRLFDEMTTIREAAMTTRFQMPADDQWNESPRGGVSWATRGVGWLMAVVWAVSITGFGLWHAWHGTQSLLERLLVFGGLSAFALLLISVVLDRISTWKTDRYRGVKR